MDGQELIPSVIGPLGQSIHDLRILVKTIIDAQPWNIDPQVSKQPWDSSAQIDVENDCVEKRLSFAVLMHDDIVMPHSPITRALIMTVEKLRACGHEVREDL
jgi:amidase